MNKSRNEGITLIALVITIIVMLILIGVTINLSLNGGLFGYAKQAKNSTEVASERETVMQAIAIAKMNNLGEKITVEQMQEALNQVAKEGEITAIDNEETIIVKFNNSQRCYEVDEKGNLEYLGIIKEKILTVICKDSNNEEIKTTTYNILTSKYSITAPEIEGWEASKEKIEGTIEENAEISLLYYKIFGDDTILVFTGLDSEGNVTENEEEIESYMVGKENAPDGNGFKEEQTVQGILKIPEFYKEKPVLKIAYVAFAKMYNVIKFVDIGDEVQEIEDYAFYRDNSMVELVIGKKVNSIGRTCVLGPWKFKMCYNKKRFGLGDCFQ